jgi:hypothetical protein
MRKSVQKNALCSCGSGKKYKYCCYKKDWNTKQAQRKMVTFSFDDDSHVQRKVHSMDSIPTHNANGLTSNIPKEQLVAMILDDFFRILSTEEVGTLTDLTNRIVTEMNIVPVFTYRDLGNALEADPRFEHYCMQLICLAGNNPVELYINKMGT